MKIRISPKMLYFGTPVVLVSSLNDDGSTNLAPMSSAWWVGDTAMLGMSVNSQTVRNLQHRPGCVLNLVHPQMVHAVDRLALLTGRPDVPAGKLARGYRYVPDKFTAAGVTPVPVTGVAEHPPSGQPRSGGPEAATPSAVGESLIHLRGVVRNMHAIDAADSGLLALEVLVTSTHVDEALLLPDDPSYIDPLLWDPLIMKFTEYFAGGAVARVSSLASGWEVPALRGAAGSVAVTPARAQATSGRASAVASAQ